MFSQRTIIFFLLSILPATISQAYAARVALVIGNGRYQDTSHLPELANATNDSEDIAKALRGFGFQVIENKNLSHESMDAAIAEFGRKISNSEAALFYFAGHGMQVKGQNYLLPVDAKIAAEEQVSYKSINVNQILETMDNAQSQANIVILDACRNNPLSGKFRSGSTRGLAPTSSQPKSTVIVYATDPGNTSSDGEGRNGLFTAGLLTAFKGQDLSLHGVLVLTSAEVERGSENKQSPYVNGPMTLQENFLFAPGQINTPAIHTDMITPALDPAIIEKDFWDSIKDSSNAEDYRAYLEQYPKGKFAALARNRLKTPVPVAVRPELTPAPITEQPDKAALSIGSPGPAGGIVFYVDNTGAHGLEAKTADEPNEMTWDAAMAANYGLGWRLPTKDELNLLYQQKTVVGGFAINYYWSSTEDDSGYAWSQLFPSGYQYYFDKNYPLPVRAVRAF